MQSGVEQKAVPSVTTELQIAIIPYLLGRDDILSDIIISMSTFWTFSKSRFSTENLVSKSASLLDATFRKSDFH